MEMELLSLKYIEFIFQQNFTEFILKYCTPAALQKYNKGILLSKHDLRLPANPQHIDVLNENFDKLLKAFDGEGQDSLFHYG